MRARSAHDVLAEQQSKLHQFSVISPTGQEDSMAFVACSKLRNWAEEPASTFVTENVPKCFFGWPACVHLHPHPHGFHICESLDFVALRPFRNDPKPS